MFTATTRKVYIRKLQQLDSGAPPAPPVTVEDSDDDDDIVEVATPPKSPPKPSRPMTARARAPLHSG